VRFARKNCALPAVFRWQAVDSKKSRRKCMSAYGSRTTLALGFGFVGDHGGLRDSVSAS
jgi:hypothetical protein